MDFEIIRSFKKELILIIKFPYESIKMLRDFYLDDILALKFEKYVKNWTYSSLFRRRWID